MNFNNKTKALERVLFLCTKRGNNMNKTETKTVYAYTKDGLLIGERSLDYTDRSPISGAWQIPANMTETKPKKDKDGYNQYFEGDKWVYKEIPKEPEPEDVEKNLTPQEEYVSEQDEVILALQDMMMEQAETIAELQAEVKALKGGE